LKGSYLMIEDDELEAIEIGIEKGEQPFPSFHGCGAGSRASGAYLADRGSNHTIDIDSFAPHAEFDERFLESPYYIAPSEPAGQEAFALMREAMRGKAYASFLSQYDNHSFV